ncbi:MAG: aconitase family protein [Candidatus Neomarinimicrobiota bacterium]|nr:aconitase family protein [Candidatus Neomarinimicrobiota bacterium]MDD3965603.1 aconitase family protein [Candidatus Neomarinimicrobiota bacterium]MDX9779415.1 aconitase family protein [bacterium]
MKVNTSMVQQLLAQRSGQNAVPLPKKVRVRPDALILNTASAGLLLSLPENQPLSLPVYMIQNELPLEGNPEPELIAALQKRGITYLHGTRSGFPALVAAEEGLAFPGGIVAAADPGLSELGAFGTLLLQPDPNSLAALIQNGEVEIPVPEICSIELHSVPGEWTGGTDIALALLKYYDLPKDGHSYLEFSGEGLSALSLPERHNLLRVLADLGYPNLLCQADDKCMAFLQDRSEGEAQFYSPAEITKAAYRQINVDLSGITPMLAWIENNQLQIGGLTDKDALPIQQVIIGGDTGGRYEDFEAGLKLIRYRMLPEQMNACLLPGSQLVHGDLLDMGIAGIFTEIGFQIFPAAFQSLLNRYPDRRRTRLSSSAGILKNGGYLAGALSCFSAAVNGAIIHPMEMENILKNQEKEYSHYEPEA